MSAFVLAQFFGLAGLVLSLSIFQTNKRRSMLRISMAACSLYITQYILLGAYTGAAMNVIGVTRGYAYYKLAPNKKHRWVLYTFMILAAVATLLTWQGPISLLALFGSACNGFAVWHKDPKYIRRWALLAPPLWFIYSYMSGSYPGMASAFIMLISNLVGEYRYDFKHISYARRHFAHSA